MCKAGITFLRDEPLGQNPVSHAAFTHREVVHVNSSAAAVLHQLHGLAVPLALDDGSRVVLETRAVRFGKRVHL